MVKSPRIRDATFHSAVVPPVEMTGPLTTTHDIDDRAATDSRRVISATNLRFSNHNGTTAVRNVTLDIRKGEFFEHFGPNGAGGNLADHEARDATDNKTTRKVRENQ